MIYQRLKVAFLSLSLCLSACQAVAPEPPAGPSPMGTFGVVRAVEPRFLVVEAANGQLDPEAIEENATVELYYTEMKPRDKAWVQWRGAHMRSTAVQTLPIARLLKFDLPRAWLEENAGQTVQLVYFYQPGGTGAQVSSAPITVQVVGARLDPVFTVVGAADGVLNTSTLVGDASVKVLHPGMAAGDQLQLTWVGTAQHSTAVLTAEDRTGVSFTVPRAWILENMGVPVSLFYSYRAAGSAEQLTSEHLALQVTSNSVIQGQQLAARLNARYNDTRNDCDGQPAYYCNGVLIRVTGYGSTFHSWNPSPAAVTLGGVSFSYVRRDVGTTHLSSTVAAGMIFKDFATAQHDHDTAVRLLCSFPSDAQSQVRANNGCGVHQWSGPGSAYCSSQGIDTVAKWVAHYGRVSGSDSRYRSQCAFASTLAAFALSIQVRQHFPAPAIEATQNNEVVLQTWAQDIPTTLPLDAFFYAIQGTPAEQAQALEGARYIQQDFLDSTHGDVAQGRLMPIVRVQLSTDNAPAFSFAVGDQVQVR